MKTILNNQLREVLILLNKIQRKANLYNLEFQYTISETYTKTMYQKYVNPITQTIDNLTTQKFEVKVNDITITSSNITYNKDWKVLALIEHCKEFNLITPINTTSIPEEWYNLQSNCDHCNHKRYRRKTFILEHKTEGFKQVGSTCLLDYTGIDLNLLLNFAKFQEIEVIDEYKGINNPKLKEYFISDYRCIDFLTAIALSFQSINKNGYIKTNEDKSTKSEVIKMINNNIQPKQEFIDLGNEMIDYINKIDYNVNNPLSIPYLKLFAKNEYIIMKNLGLVVYLPTAFDKIKQKDTKSKYIGNIGEKFEENIQNIKMTSSYINKYGIGYIYKITTDKGNNLTWFSSKELNLENNSYKKIKGTIKDYSEFNGNKETIVTRCKLS